MNLYINLAMAVLTCAYCTRPQNNTCTHDTQPARKQEITHVLQRIDSTSAGLVSMRELRKLSDFLTLFDAPELYRDDVLQLLTSDQISRTHKMWLVESQCKCDEVYLSFCTSVLQLYKTGQLGADGESIIHEMLAPANSTTLPFLKKENTAFRVLMQELKQVPTLSPDLAKFIGNIESGYVLEHWELYY